MLQGGDGVDISGAGSLGNPYVITANGAIQNSLQVIDSPTLDLALTGEGTSVEPLVLQGTVQLAMDDLTDVSATPKNMGDVPVWVGDHWDYQPPPTVPPGAVSVGSGLTGDGSGAAPLSVAIVAADGVLGSGTTADPLRVDVYAGDGLQGDGNQANPLKVKSGEVWGTGVLSKYGAGVASSGEPVYVDETGALRSRPQIITDRAQSDAPTTYPFGITLQAITGGDATALGWPSSGMVHTLARPDGVTYQWFLRSGMDEAHSIVQYRVGTSSTWSPWRIIGGPQQPQAEAQGEVMLNLATNPTAAVVVTLPPGRFVDPPRVFLQAVSSSNWIPTVRALTTSQFQITAARALGAEVSGSLRVWWSARQMTALSADG